MAAILTIIKYIAVLVAAMLIGQSFLGEIKKAKALNLPWYRPYLTLPGIVVILAILMPLVIKFLK